MGWDPRVKQKRKAELSISALLTLLCWQRVPRDQLLEVLPCRLPAPRTVPPNWGQANPSFRRYPFLARILWATDTGDSRGCQPWQLSLKKLCRHCMNLTLKLISKDAQPTAIWCARFNLLEPSRAYCKIRDYTAIFLNSLPLGTIFLVISSFEQKF